MLIEIVGLVAASTGYLCYSYLKERPKPQAKTPEKLVQAFLIDMPDGLIYDEIADITIVTATDIRKDYWKKEYHASYETPWRKEITVYAGDTRQDGIKDGLKHPRIMSMTHTPWARTKEPDHLLTYFGWHQHLEENKQRQAEVFKLLLGVQGRIILEPEQKWTVPVTSPALAWLDGAKANAEGTPSVKRLRAKWGNRLTVQ